MADVIAIPKPKTTAVSWPWHLRHLQHGEVSGARCKFCGRDVAKPVGDHFAICVYCALDRGVIPVEDKPI